MKKRINIVVIRTACFFAALIAAVAGFAFSAHRIKKEYKEKDKAYLRLYAAEAGAAFEGISEAMGELFSSAPEKRGRVLSDLRLNALSAERALGQAFEGENGGEQVFAFLGAVSLMAQNALELGMAEDPAIQSGAMPSFGEFHLLNSYNDRLLTAFEFSMGDIDSFYKSAREIFSDTALETLIYERGYGVAVPGASYGGIEGGYISQSEAKAVARKYIGKSAAVDSVLSEKSGIYHFYGENISALVDGRSGSIMQFLFDSAASGKGCEEVEAEKIASDFMESLGFDASAMSFERRGTEGGLYIFRFTPIYDGVICISESITVGVSESTGRIRLFDAVDYYKYHRKKLVLPEACRTKEDIASEYPNADDITLCKIERAEGVESFCYRFFISDSEVTVSALTGLRIDG